MIKYDLLDKDDNKQVKKIILEIRVLRTKKERTKECGYGPGKKSFGHKCNHCEEKNTICLAIHETIDDSGYSYVTSDENIVKSLGIICEPTLNIKDIDFGGLFLSFKMQHIHRHFKETDVSLLAIFSVFEFLHNLNAFINDINYEQRMKVINETAGTRQILGIKEDNNYRPHMIEYYKMRINWLKDGKIDVCPEVWNYVLNGKNIDDNKKREMEKQAADEALNMLKKPVNIIKFIENAIEGDYNFQ